MFIWPLADHILTRLFDYLSSIYVGGQHAALDLIRRTGVTCASPILAVAAGTVAGVGWDMYSGFFVAIDHAGGWRSFYRHMYGQAPVVVGQQVAQGQIIGNVGNTGWSTGDHLHFDLWHREKQDATAFWKADWWAHDPELYMGKEDEMTPEERTEFNEMKGTLAHVQLTQETLIGQMQQLLAANNDFLIVQGQVNQLIEQSQGEGLKRGDKMTIKDGTLE